jgi:hypothetical protein
MDENRKFNSKKPIGTQLIGVRKKPTGGTGTRSADCATLCSAAVVLAGAANADGAQDW